MWDTRGSEIEEGGLGASAYWEERVLGNWSLPNLWNINIEFILHYLLFRPFLFLIIYYQEEFADCIEAMQEKDVLITKVLIQWDRMLSGQKAFPVYFLFVIHLYL